VKYERERRGLAKAIDNITQKWIGNISVYMHSMENSPRYG